METGRNAPRHSLPLPSFLRRQESIRRASAADGAQPRLPSSQAPRHSRESGNLLGWRLRRGEGAGDGARCAPSFLRRQESIRRASAADGAQPRLPSSQAPRHSRESGNLLGWRLRRGEGAGDGARCAPSFLRRQESIRRASAADGAQPRLPSSQAPRHSRESGNLLGWRLRRGEGAGDGARCAPSFLRRQESIRRASAADGRAPVCPHPQAPRHSRESGNLLGGACGGERVLETGRNAPRHSCVGRNPFGAQAPQTGARPSALIPRRLAIPAKAGTYWGAR